MKFLTPKNFSRHCFVGDNDDGDGDNDDGDNSDNGVDDVDGDDYHSNVVGDGFLVRDENKNNGKERGKKRQKVQLLQDTNFYQVFVKQDRPFPGLVGIKIRPKINKMKNDESNVQVKHKINVLIIQSFLIVNNRKRVDERAGEK